MKQVALVSPSDWDLRQVSRLSQAGRSTTSLRPYGENLEKDPGAVDQQSYLRLATELFRDKAVAGITSSSDYPGALLSAILANRLRLPGPAPLSMIRSSHKYYSRLQQAVSVPEVTPAFSVIDPKLPSNCFSFEYPLFIKPVRSSFSRHARLVASPSELETYIASPSLNRHIQSYVRPFNEILADFRLPRTAGFLIVEEPLVGRQFTLEGYVRNGSIAVLGCVDSIMYPNTISFQRFEYPSSIEDRVLEQARAVTSRIISGLGLDQCAFNIEFMFDDTHNRLSIIEINPRLSPQFAHLFEHVNGLSTYDVVASLAVGESPPKPRRAGLFDFAASFVLRKFTDQVVTKSPSESAVKLLEEKFAPALIMDLCRGMSKLSDSSYQSDGASFRYCVINVLASNRLGADAQFEEISAALGYEFADAN